MVPEWLASAFEILPRLSNSQQLQDADLVDRKRQLYEHRFDSRRWLERIKKHIPQMMVSLMVISSWDRMRFKNHQLNKHKLHSLKLSACSPLKIGQNGPQKGQ